MARIALGTSYRITLWGQPSGPATQLWTVRNQPRMLRIAA